MIDLFEIFVAAQIESLQAMFNGAAKNPQHNETLSEANVYKALMTFSQSLLEEYHKALQAELAKQGIEI
ncbi:MAG: hypothetical protein K2K53_08390 [Oscillospiraceae bacterium]|nr:hypothetical protein [Oscillospiraceae bacterium]